MDVDITSVGAEGTLIVDEVVEESNVQHLFKLGKRGMNVSVTNYGRNLKVHLGYHKTDPVTGHTFPTKKGVRLSLDEWFDFKSKFAEIDELVSASMDLTFAEEKSRTKPTGPQQNIKTGNLPTGNCWFDYKTSESMCCGSVFDQNDNAVFWCHEKTQPANTPPPELKIKN